MNNLNLPNHFTTKMSENLTEAKCGMENMESEEIFTVGTDRQESSLVVMREGKTENIKTNYCLH